MLHLPSLETARPLSSESSPQARGTPACGRLLPRLQGAGPSIRPDLRSGGRRGLCSSKQTLPPASGPQACPACWTSAPCSPGQLDPSLPAADQSPRGWPPSGPGPARPAQGRGCRGRPGSGGMLAWPDSPGCSDPAGGLTHHSGACPQTDKGRCRARSSTGASGPNYNSQEAPRGPARQSPGLGGSGFPEHCGKRSSAAPSRSQASSLRPPFCCSDLSVDEEPRRLGHPGEAVG